MKDKELKRFQQKQMETVGKVYLQLIPGNGATLVTGNGSHLQANRGFGTLLLANQLHGGQP